MADTKNNKGVSIEEQPIAQVLLTCAKMKKSGLLIVTDDKKMKVVVLVDGVISGCRSNLPDESLFHILKEREVVDPTKLKEVAASLEDQDGYPLLNALQAANLLDAGQMTPLLSDQLWMRLGDLLSWERGVLRLKPLSSAVFNDGVPLNLNTQTILFRALAKQPSAATVPGRFVANETTDFNIETIQFTDEEREIFIRLAQETAPSEIATQTGCEEAAVTSFANALVTLGLFSFV
mgnify:CR=1 FL=1